jgi:hypothetical protein
MKLAEIEFPNLEISEDEKRKAKEFMADLFKCKLDSDPDGMAAMLKEMAIASLKDQK